jgi:7,8-dihydropterin-6-yl-methyl-4-(beta-D-ribofuranosyl)aminobenzene 5'-phosphate synthase
MIVVRQEVKITTLCENSTPGFGLLREYGLSMESRLARTLEALREFDIKKVAPCHCTGFRATAALHQAFGENFMLNRVGSVFKFG